MPAGIGTGAIYGGIGSASPHFGKRTRGGGHAVSTRRRRRKDRDKGGGKPQSPTPEEKQKRTANDLANEGKDLDNQLKELKLNAAKREEEIATLLFDDKKEIGQGEANEKLAQLQQGAMLDFYEMAKLTRRDDGMTMAGELVDESMRWLGGNTKDTVARFYKDDSGEERLGLFRKATKAVSGINPDTGQTEIGSVDAGWEPVLHEGQPVDFSVNALEQLRTRVRPGDIEKETAKAKARGSAERTPAQVATAEWLMKNVNVNADTAWKMVNTAKSDPKKLALDLFRKRRADVEKNLTTESEEETRDWVERTMKMFDRQAAGGGGGIDAGGEGIDAGGGEPVTVKTKADFDKLKSGTKFIDPTGKVRIKP